MKKVLRGISIFTMAIMLCSITPNYKVNAASPKKSSQTITSEKDLLQFCKDNNLTIPASKKTTEKNITPKAMKPGKSKLVKSITDKNEIEEYCKENNLPLISPEGKEIDHIEVIEELYEDTTEPMQIESTIEAIPIIDYVVEDTPLNFTGSDYYAYASGEAPGTITLSETYTEAATWSANVSVTVDAITAGVGFDVTESYSITPTTAQGGATIYAYPRYKGTTFRVMRLLVPIGAGLAYRPIGSSYKVVYWK